MKKTELINSELSAVISRMGHTDSLVIGDCGLPIPNGIQRIDLALVRNQPRFLDTLRAVLTELFVECVVVADELVQGNPMLLEQIKTMLPDADIKVVSHEELKKRTESAKAIVRTGECTPYANIILYSGVKF
ncbi:MAG: D-ribose pyranase [Clostridia bacterium]